MFGLSPFGPFCFYSPRLMYLSQIGLWERNGWRTQRDKLVAKQRKKIAEMEKEIADSIPIEESNKSLPKKNNI